MQSNGTCVPASLPHSVRPAQFLLSGIVFAPLFGWIRLVRTIHADLRLRRTTVNYRFPKNKLPLFGLLPILIGVLAFGPALLGAQVRAPQNNGHSPLQSIPVTGTIASNGGTFEGTLSIVSFADNAGVLVANGLLTGTLRDATGQVIGTVTDEYVPNIPVGTGAGGAPQATCH